MARILVADDDPLSLAVMSRALEKAHHDVVTATDGAKALDIFLGDKFDCLVCALSLRDPSGLHVVRDARHHASRAAIIALVDGKPKAGGVHVDVLNMAHIVGASAVVKKPFEMFDFVATVEGALGVGAKKPSANA